jgi:hypothetical protein
MRAVPSLLLALAFLLGPFSALPGPSDASPPPFGIGDWVITGNETLENRSLMLVGNLTIESGGSLTISNSSLTVYCKYSEEHEIEVLPGGTLRVLNDSMINSLGEWNTFGFWIRKDATVVFEDSMFITCGVRVIPGTTSGGIMIYTDNATIRDCTFTGAFWALTIMSLNVELRDCIFYGNYGGLSGSASCINCTFANNGYGASAAGYFERCEFSSSAIGLWGVDCIVRNCTFTQNFGMGLYAYGRTRVIDCEFVKNSIATACPDPELAYGVIYLTNSNFSDNSRATYTPLHEWTVNRSCRIRNDTIAIGGNVTVESGGNLSLNRSVLKIDNTDYRKNGIDVKSGGRLTLEPGSTIQAYNASFPYSFRCRPGSSFCMNGSLLRDCGWNLSAPNWSGPLFETSNVRINSSTIDFNPAALVFNGSRGAIIEGSSLRGMELGLFLNSSSVAFRNSTLATVDGNSASLDRGSLLDSVNSALNRSRLDFKDATSRANFSWLVDVRAVWADGRPVEGANLTIQDANSAVVNRTVTDADGYARGEILIETSLQRNAALNLTPHLFNCTRGSIWNRTVLTVNNSQEIPLVLADDQPPTINITYPSDGIFLDSGSVILAGTARDNMGLDRIEVVLDGQSRQTVFLSGGGEYETASWNASFVLNDGYHFFEAAATDISGNSASAFVSIWVDTVSPRIRIASPQEGQLTNISLITVSGFMEPGAMVYICGTEAKTDRDMFSGSLTISEGLNTIMAAAVDAAGNTNSTSVTVLLDTTPPRLEVLSPDDGLRTRSPTVEVSGSMEPGSDVYVNGRQVALGAEPGVFRTAISLTKEVTTVTVDAVDKAGNHNLTTRKVLLDTTPPFLRLSSPAEGLVTNRSSILVTGEAEGGSYLTVAENSQQLQGAPPARASFSTPVTLHEGLNIIVVTALDMAGNTNKSTLHVTLDTVAPLLAVETPLNGSRTANSTILVEGFTEPGARLTVNGQQVPVGYTGSFSAEVRISTGNNSIAVRAEDAAGNSADASVSVQRVPSRGEMLRTSGAGPDWRFIIFIGLSAAVAAGEGYYAVAYFARRPISGARREGV